MNYTDLTTQNEFLHRHIGPNSSEIAEMLRHMEAVSVEQLIGQTIPEKIRLDADIEIGQPMTEFAYLRYIAQIAAANKLCRSFIGMGFYNTITPPVIQRNIFENPGWYTQYTPYQAEISQGRLEALLNFQTMVADLTGMTIANASLLDEATAAAEAMQMLHRVKNKKPGQESNLFLVSDTCLPVTLDVLQTRAQPLGIEIKVQNHAQFEFTPHVFGCLLQYPAHNGAVFDFETVAEKAHQAEAYVAVVSDLMSLTLLTPPGQWGADVVVGNSQRFGVPMGYGGPHAAFFATREEFVRQAPGRIIGVSVDRQGKQAYRMTLQTREQHIKRDKATSNICTAQALLAIMAGMYAVYHGPEGLTRIAQRIHALAQTLETALTQLGYRQVNSHYFDTLLIDLGNHPNTSGARVRRVAELEEINFRYFENQPDLIGISLDETCTLEDVQRITRVFAEAVNEELPDVQQLAATAATPKLPAPLQRTGAILTHPVFHSYRSETQMLRYIKKLEGRDLSLTRSMIPLGSCTMKLNATAQLMPVSFAQFSQLHPFIPRQQAAGYTRVFEELEQALCKITGFAACSLQPNSGAQGEYAGLMTIRSYHHSRGNTHRNVTLIPSSAHGTNPASAVMAGMEVVVVKCDEQGNIDLNDLAAKAEQYAENLAALMVTYPSTHGVFEEGIHQACEMIHRFGGQVYMDGANMNAQVGYTSPAMIGADVCHLNLHKTFSIPHGGGGPGMGPICVAAHLEPFLPTHRFITGQEAVPSGNVFASAPWGSASILLISHAYIHLLGSGGVKTATAIAILNANYIKSRLAGYYDVLYVGANNRVAHELILDLRTFKRTAGIEAEDVAKRLMDYGFHAPTVSFPVAGTVMIEPTESEAKEELDRFCDAMIAIREEIAEIEKGLADVQDNVLKNAPHSLGEITSDEWNHAYTRQKAAFPLPYLHENKFWTYIARIDNTWGDRHLMCTCPPLEAYAG
ncbi:glycine dehydrogenase (aminomethyl-transferring) [Sphingobacteriales bacterium UPWRP_1]|nr:glycine dehydrogenase (aminomethyl-transferring) [Sphingobacteriales bacterium TSM_CSS]PSJ73141.1 glycine dehydrogenase (aminomethyl-transferring) [Sphingobacteriales bacterium UPWRP_1]